MTRFLVLLLALLLFSWMVQRGLRTLAGRAARHPLAQLLRLLLGGPTEPPQSQRTDRPGQPARRLVRCQRCGTHVPPERVRSAAGETLCDQCE